MFWLAKFFTKGKTVKDALKYFHTLNGRMPNNLETIKIKNAFMEQNRGSNVIDITSRIKDEWWKQRPGFIRQHPGAAKKIKETEAQIKARMIKENRSNVQKSYLRQLDEKIMDEMGLTKADLENMSSTALDDLRRSADPVGMRKQFDEITEGRGLGDFPDDPLKEPDYASGGLARVALGGGKLVFEGLKKFLQNKKTVRKAVDDIFPTGDYKYDAEMAAEALVENNPKFFKNKLYDDLSDADRMEVYGSVLSEVQNDLAKMLEARKLSKPTKTLEGIKKEGTIDISNPEVADEFSRFMKESDPEGFKDLEQKIEIEGFDVTGRKKNASGGIAGQLHMNEGGRVPMWLGGGLPKGKSLLRDMMKYFSKGSKHGKSPSEMLKLVNPKVFQKYLDDPSIYRKYNKETGIMAPQMIQEMMEKIGKDRVGVIEDILRSARTIKKADDSVVTFKTQVITFLKYLFSYFYYSPIHVLTSRIRLSNSSHNRCYIFIR